MWFKIICIENIVQRQTNREKPKANLNRARMNICIAHDFINVFKYEYKCENVQLWQCSKWFHCICVFKQISQSQKRPQANSDSEINVCSYGTNRMQTNYANVHT